MILKRKRTSSQKEASITQSPISEQNIDRFNRYRESSETIERILERKLPETVVDDVVNRKTMTKATIPRQVDLQYWKSFEKDIRSTIWKAVKNVKAKDSCSIALEDLHLQSEKHVLGLFESTCCKALNLMMTAACIASSEGENEISTGILADVDTNAVHLLPDKCLFSVAVKNGVADAAQGKKLLLPIELKPSWKFSEDNKYDQNMGGINSKDLKDFNFRSAIEQIAGYMQVKAIRKSQSNSRRIRKHCESIGMNTSNVLE